MDGARVTLRTDAELERPPGDARQAVDVYHAKSVTEYLCIKIRTLNFFQQSQLLSP